MTEEKDSTIWNKGDPVRLGTLVPSVNTIVEPDMYRMAPSHVTVHFSRLAVPTDQVTLENLERLTDRMEESLHCLAQARVKAVAFACTSGSFIKGVEWDQEMIRRMEEIIAPATTTSHAVVSALHRLGAAKLALITPYSDPVNKRMASYFESQGFQITSFSSLGFTETNEIAGTSPEKILSLAKSSNYRGSDAMVISCTNFRASTVIKAIESETMMPVVSSNQATIWKLLELADCDTPVTGYGRLLASLGS